MARRVGEKFSVCHDDFDAIYWSSRCVCVWMYAMNFVYFRRSHHTFDRFFAWQKWRQREFHGNWSLLLGSMRKKKTGWITFCLQLRCQYWFSQNLKLRFNWKSTTFMVEVECINYVRKRGHALQEARNEWSAAQQHKHTFIVKHVHISCTNRIWFISISWNQIDR